VILESYLSAARERIEEAANTLVTAQRHMEQDLAVKDRLRDGAASRLIRQVIEMDPSLDPELCTVRELQLKLEKRDVGTASPGSRGGDLSPVSLGSTLGIGNAMARYADELREQNRLAVRLNNSVVSLGAESQGTAGHSPLSANQRFGASLSDKDVDRETPRLRDEISELRYRVLDLESQVRERDQWLQQSLGNVKSHELDARATVRRLKDASRSLLMHAEDNGNEDTAPSPVPEDENDTNEVEVRIPILYLIVSVFRSSHIELSRRLHWSCPRILNRPP
jgi:hypothetical protein